MTWSYSGDPSDSALDAVRFLIGDTNESDQQFNDAEINFLVSEEGGTYQAAAKAADVLASKFARLADETVGQVSINYSQMFDHYQSLANTIRQRAAVRGAMPYAAGISTSDKEANQLDESIVKPIFTRDMHDYEDVGIGEDDDG